MIFKVRQISRSVGSIPGLHWTSMAVNRRWLRTAWDDNTLSADVRRGEARTTDWILVPEIQNPEGGCTQLDRSQATSRTLVLDISCGFLGVNSLKLSSL